MFVTRMPIISIACAAGILAACGTAAGQYYVATTIGPLPEQPGPTWVWDINDDGVVFGTAHVNGSRESRCFLLDDGTLTIFASDEGHPFIWAGAINNATAFVGTQSVTAPFGTTRKSFVGLPETLPDLFAQFPSGDASHGRDINNSVADAAPGLLDRSDWMSRSASAPTARSAATSCCSMATPTRQSPFQRRAGPLFVPRR